MRLKAVGAAEIFVLGRISRSMTWSPLILATAMGALAVVVYSSPHLHTEQRVTTGLRIFALMLAVGASFAFDRQAVEFECATARSTNYVTRRRIGLALLLLLFVWGLALIGVKLRGAQPPIGLIVELLALSAVGSAIGLEVCRSYDPRMGGTIGGTAVLALGLALRVAPEGWVMYAPTVANAAWGPSRWRWLVVALLAGSVATLREWRRTGWEH